MEPVPYSQMRDRVTVQERAVTQDGAGAPLLAWADVRTVWALIEPLEGTEQRQAGRAVTDLSHRVTLRYFDGLTPRHRLLIAGTTRVLGIASVSDPEHRHREHVLLCREGVP